MTTHDTFAWLILMEVFRLASLLFRACSWLYIGTLFGDKMLAQLKRLSNHLLFYRFLLLGLTFFPQIHKFLNKAAMLKLKRLIGLLDCY
jgi:hypothetical protein